METEKKFKVLVIAYYFPPLGFSGVQRTLKLCKYISHFGWEPTVITTGKAGYYAHDESMLEEAHQSNIRIIRTEGKDINSLLGKFGTIKMPNESIRKMFSLASKTTFIPDNKASWSKRAYKTAVELLHKESFDLIYITIPPFSTFQQCLKLKKEFHTPVFVDYRDLWVDNQFAFYPTPYHLIRHKRMEEGLLRQVDKIIVTNRVAKERIMSRYKFLDFDDIVIMTHGYDETDLINIPFEREDKNKVIITYSGTFYEKIKPDYFLKAFKRVEVERPDIAANIELHFISNLRKNNLKLIKKLNLQGYVKEFGYLEHKDAVKKLMNSDILWMMFADIPNSDAVAPGKLFEYIGTRKPIIACVNKGAAYSAASEYQCSKIVPPNDVEEIKKAIINIYTEFKKGEIPPPNEEFIQKHNRKYIAENLVKEFQFFLREDI